MNFDNVMHLSAFQLLELLKKFEQYYLSRIGKARFLLQ